MPRSRSCDRLFPKACDALAIVAAVPNATNPIITTPHNIGSFQFLRKAASYLRLFMMLQTKYGEITNRVICRIFINVMNLDRQFTHVANATGPVMLKHDVR